MALRLRKDIKKSSYYVWFLGAKESHGLRGEEYILPVIRHLIERERDIEPFKVTLQISHKGLKIIQNIITPPTAPPVPNTKPAKPKSETIKHFIPHNTITCVLQHEDIVACILLLYNPVTKCPLHVHAYRCDSLETATLLKSQLQVLIDRPENQKKLGELEHRLNLKQTGGPKLKVNKKNNSLGSSDTATTVSSKSDLEDPPNRFNSTTSSNESRIANLYDSLAAELRQKLGKNDPILLPPRDYDTVHRAKGNLTGIELRRSMNTNIVGVNLKNSQNLQRVNGKMTRGGSAGGLESSGGSSGIGSDHAPSPDDNCKEDTSVITGPEGHPHSHHRYGSGVDNQSSSDEDWNAEPTESSIYLMHGQSPPRTEPLPRIRTQPEPEDLRRPQHTDPYIRKQADPYIRKSEYAKPTQRHPNDRPEYIVDKRKQPQYFGDHHYPETREYQKKPNEYEPNYYDEEVAPMRRQRAEYRQRSPSPKQIIIETSPKDRFKDAKEKFLSLEKQREQERLAMIRRNTVEKPISPVNNRRSMSQYPRQWNEEDNYDESRKYPNQRYYEEKPRFEENRYDRYADENRRVEQRYTEDNRYDDKTKYFNRYNEQSNPKPAPRNLREYDVPLERYRNDDPKRRSMYNLIEDEHRRSSNEIAKELKRRTYAEPAQDYEPRYYDEYPEGPVSPSSRLTKSTLDLDKIGNHNRKQPQQVVPAPRPAPAKSTLELDQKYSPSKGPKVGAMQNVGGYRHSYAEPKLRLERMGGKKLFPDMLHRANSSVSNSGRVGIASIHPY